MGLTVNRHRAAPGVTNTGDANAADVAAGKTFSSAALTNATGTSTKNGTVSSGAAIQPAQSYIDCVPILIEAAVQTSGLMLSNRGIVSYDISNPAFQYPVGNGAGVGIVDFSANNLTSASVEALLSYLATLAAYGGYTFSLDISGGTNAAPVKDTPASGTLDLSGGSAFLNSGEGDSLTLPGPSGSIVFWANVDGANTQPSVSGATYVEMAINGSGNEGETASTFASYLNANGYAAVAVGGALSFNGSAAGYQGSNGVTQVGMGMQNLTFVDEKNFSVETIKANGSTVASN